MQPEIQIRDDSFFYRIYNLLYKKDPQDTCQYRARLLKIFLVYCPLFFVFVIIPMLYCVYISISDWPDEIDQCSTIFLIGLCEWVVVIMGLVPLSAVFIVHKHGAYFLNANLLNVLKITGGVLLGIFSAWTIVIIVEGHAFWNSVSDDGRLHLGFWDAGVSFLGCIWFFILSIILMLYIYGGIVDSKTYNLLKTSAKEKWCAKIVVVRIKKETDEDSD